MWKKVITAILLTCVLPLMACGAEGIETGEAASKGTVENSADTGGKVSGESAPEELTGELTILSWLPVNTWQYVIEDFMKEYPGVTVRVEMLGEDQLVTEEFMEKYTTRIMAGDGFDIVESELVNMEKCAGLSC